MSVKKKATKKPSAKQKAARAKFAAAAKARAKTAKKTTAKKWVKKADGTRTRTAAAKKARKAKNTVEGYYPNPLSYFYVYAQKGENLKYWFTGENFSRLKGDAKYYKTESAVRNDKKLFNLAKKLPSGYAVKLVLPKK